MNKKYVIALVALFSFGAIIAQNTNESKFKQLGQELPTPNVYRTASGAPGPQYYQQKADYNISVELDDENQKITGSERVTYTNNSPDPLNYLWLQLDQNKRALDSDTRKISKGTIPANPSPRAIERFFYDFDGGFKIETVTNTSGKDLPYTINNTMMRIDLDKPLLKGQKVSFDIKWWYNINDRMKIGGRSGLEYFEEEDNYLYTIAQFFPRMAVYNDVEGWQNKQFLGGGEFAVPFGDYTVNITVPADHIVGSTGKLQNASSVLTSDQRKRWAEAQKSYDTPVMIVTPEEALEAEKTKSSEMKTWTFKATNVRDFAFASSRKFIWDAMAVDINGKNVMAVSYYPKEGNPLWEKYSTRVVAHTIKTYSKFTIDYPYHKAISVHANRIGMEYPQICFNGGRPEADGTYSSATKHGMISVIIHEVGHNFFPMIINSDERQWTWMDEGLNTFVQYLTEQEWDMDYPFRRGPAYKITDYMKGDKSKIMPIMTNSESIIQFGNNAYGKPATALNILRETVMGRELFDFAFKEYCRRWAFKHPSPADLFRTMEDASAVDLDWYWRGWFFTTDHVDVSLNGVKEFDVKLLSPETVSKSKEAQKEAYRRHIGYQRNKDMETVVKQDSTMKDFYNSYNPDKPTKQQEEAYTKKQEALTPKQKEILNSGSFAYEAEFENIGGLVMPLILEVTFEDGSTEVLRIPAEIWIKNETKFSKVMVFEKKAVKIELDPFYEMADTDRNNNFWPAAREESRFDGYKQRRQRGNPMQQNQ
jgi:hypothetical protein